MNKKYSQVKSDFEIIKEHLDVEVYRTEYEEVFEYIKVNYQN